MYINIDEAIREYSADLSSPELIQMELKRWKNHDMAKKEDEKPSAAVEAIKE